jgi:hypothetical protein
MLSGQPEEKKEPEKNGEEKKQILRLEIDLEKLTKTPPDVVVPENQKLWESREEMSKEYIELLGTLQILALYIARNINEGPEVKDNSGKRLVLTKTVLEILIGNLAISGYDVYGLLTEMIHDIYMQISGQKRLIRAFQTVPTEKGDQQKKPSTQYVM